VSASVFRQNTECQTGLTFSPVWEMTIFDRSQRDGSRIVREMLSISETHSAFVQTLTCHYIVIQVFEFGTYRSNHPVVSRI